MGFFQNIIVLIILGIVFFGFIIPSGILSGSAFNTNFFKQAETDIIEKQEAEKHKITSKSGEQVCSLNFNVAGKFEIATKDLLTIPTKVTAYIDGSTINYKWSNCKTITKPSPPEALSLLSFFNNFDFGVYSWLGNAKPVSLDVTDKKPIELSILPVSGSTDLKIKFISSDGKFIDDKTYSSLSKTMTVNGQTPIKFSKSYFLDGMPRRDYDVNISFSDMSINEGPLSDPYVYKLKK